MIQLQFLNYILQNQDSSIIAENNLDDEFFSDYKEEFKFIKDHIDDYGNVPDQVSFLTKFQNFDVVNVSESKDYLISELYKDRNTRMMANTFNKVRDLLSDDKVDEAMKLYINSSENIVKATNISSVDILSESETKSRFNNYVQRTSDFSKYYVKTGFPELDNIIGGWDRSEELVTIVARPGVAKTWLLLKIAIAAAEQGLNVGIYSGEMSEKKIGYRIDTLISHISNTKITKGNIEVQNNYKNFLDNVNKHVKGKITVLTPTMIGNYASVLSLRAFVEKDKLDMLCVDQYSLLEDDKKGRTESEKTANIVKDMKKLQVMKQIPIIAVSQQNREKNDDGADLSQIALSDKIGQYTTIALFLERKDTIMTMNLVKVRDSTAGKKLQYALNLDQGFFNYMPTENDATNGSSCEQLREQYELDPQEGDNVF